MKENMASKLVIGLVGEKGAGKETVGNFIGELMPDKKVGRTRFSDILADTLKIWDIPPTRENLQDLAIVMRKQWGENVLSHAMQHRIETSEDDVIILDGVRWQADVDLIRSFPNNYLIYVTADLQTRYNRLSNRSEKAGEQGMSFEQFMHEETKETELLIPEIGENKANFKIKNNSTVENLKKELMQLPIF